MSVERKKPHTWLLKRRENCRRHVNSSIFILPQLSIWSFTLKLLESFLPPCCLNDTGRPIRGKFCFKFNCRVHSRQAISCLLSKEIPLTLLPSPLYYCSGLPGACSKDVKRNIPKLVGKDKIHRGKKNTMHLCSRAGSVFPLSDDVVQRNSCCSFKCLKVLA